MYQENYCVIIYDDNISKIVTFSLKLKSSNSEIVEDYLRKHLNIVNNNFIWFICGNNFEINYSDNSIGNNLNSVLVHVLGQGTDSPRINIYDYDDNLSWHDESIYYDFLKFNHNYDDVIVTKEVVCEDI